MKNSVLTTDGQTEGRLDRHSTSARVELRFAAKNAILSGAILNDNSEINMKADIQCFYFQFSSVKIRIIGNKKFYFYIYKFLRP